MSSITHEQVATMDLKSIGKAMNDPAIAADKALLRVLAVRASQLMQETQDREAAVDAQLKRVVPPSTEQLAAEATAMAAEVPVVPAPAAAVVAAKPWEAEDATLKTQGVIVTRDENGVPIRYSQEYQVRDEDGTPIGRPTYLSARTLPEFLAKKDEAHINATRAFHRLKKQKLTFKQEKPTVLTAEQIAEATKIALEEKDPAKVTDVINATIETSFEKRERELREKELKIQGAAISNEFMRRHLHDYNPCEANKKAFAEYFVEHNLEFTLDNLEAAFVDLMSQEGKLAKAEKPLATIQAAEVANPTPVATAAATETPVIPASAAPTVVPASAAPAQSQVVVNPVVEATAPTPAAAPNVQPAARRPGVNGGLAPGSLSAQRPGTPDPALTRKEFLQDYMKQKPEEMRRRLKDPQYVAKLASYGVKVR